MTKLLFINDLFVKFFPHSSEIPERFVEATWETLYMTLVTALIAGILGIFFGVILTVTYKGNILENKAVYGTLEKLINIFRSVPFIIMLALIYPVTRAIVGTTIGTTAAIVPLVVATVPFYSKQVESALLEVDNGIIEAAEAMGSSPIEIIFSVYLKEGLPALLRVSAVTVVNLIGLTAMAGAVGGGGLGNLAITRGYNRYQHDVTLLSTIIIMIIVFISQGIGNYFVKRADHTNK